MAQTAHQYNFDRFEDHVQVTPSRRKRTRAGRYAAGMRWMSKVAAAAVMLAMVCSLIYSQAQVTELTGDVQNTQADLENARSTYAYLSGQLDERSSLNNIEAQAAALGLVKMDRSQISYVTLQTESRIELPESEAEKLFEEMNTGMLSIFEYLVP